MKNIFLVNSPYHVILSKKIIEMYNNGHNSENIAIVLKESSMMDINYDYIFNEVIYMDQQKYLNKGKNILDKIKILRYNKKICKNINNILNKYDDKLQNIDKLFTFTDDVAIHQKIIKYFKKKHNTKNILIEEGTILYYPRKWRSLIKGIAYTILGFGLCQPVQYGNNKYIDLVACKFPEKANSNRKKILLPNFTFNIDDIRIFPNLDYKYLEENNENSKQMKLIYAGNPFSEQGIISLEKERSILKDIIKICDKLNILLYIKPHPRENISKYNIDEYKNAKLIKNKEVPIEIISCILGCQGAISTISSAILNMSKDMKCFFLSDLFDVKFGMNDNIKSIAENLGIKFPKTLYELEYMLSKDIIKYTIYYKKNDNNNFLLELEKIGEDDE